MICDHKVLLLGRGEWSQVCSVSQLCIEHILCDAMYAPPLGSEGVNSPARGSVQ